MSELRLNLASGTDLRSGNGWKNLDVVPQWPPSPTGIVYPPCDMYWDARVDDGKIPFPDDSADEIYAGYLLLHIPPRHHHGVLKEIRRVIKPGAPAVFGEVDMALVFPRWLADPSNVGLSWLIWGEQGDAAHGAALEEFDSHRWGFTEQKLRETLEFAGFTRISRISMHRQPDVWYELTLRCEKT